MAHSPALAHRQRVLAAARGEEGAPAARPAAAESEYALMLTRLGVDLRRLKEIQSVERKVELKRELLPAYLPWVEGVMAGDTGAADEIVTHAMIWSIDIGDYARALDIADYVLRHGLALPERFDRTAATLIVEEIVDAALKAFALKQEFPAEILHRTAALADVYDADMPDEVMAKLMKAIGLAAQRRIEDPDALADGPAGARGALHDAAIFAFRRALELDANVGVKKLLERLEADKRKAAAAAAGA